MITALTIYSVPRAMLSFLYALFCPYKNPRKPALILFQFTDQKSEETCKGSNWD